MGEHDEFCRYHEPCDCEFIARIRADERERAAQRIMTVLENDRDWNKERGHCDCMSYYCACNHSGMMDAVVAVRGGEQP